jgi:hypothetical protein
VSNENIPFFNASYNGQTYFFQALNIKQAIAIAQTAIGEDYLHGRTASPRMVMNLSITELTERGGIWTNVPDNT